MSASDIDVTVLTIAYNATPFVAACLASVRRQTGVTWEHLFIDDASTDGTPDLIQSSAAADPRIRLVRRSENGGYGPALRTAASELRGRYVAFLDADDLMRPDRLARQVAWLEANPDLLAVYADAEALAADGTPTGRRVFGAGTEAALRAFGEFSMPACHSTGCVRREALQPIAAQAGLRQAADYELVVQLLGRGRVGFLPEVVGDYRYHARQVSVTGSVLQACEGAGVAYRQARKKLGLPATTAADPAWLDALKREARSVGAVHAAFAERARAEGLAFFELYHARRAVRRGCLRALPRVLTALLARGPLAGPWRRRWTLAWAGPLRLCGISSRRATG